MKTIGFIGLGLIGGSIAKTIRKFHPDYHILAYARHKETLAAALKDGVINGVLEAEDDRYRTCDYIFLCAPVEHNIEYLKYLKRRYFRPVRHYRRRKRKRPYPRSRGGTRSGSLFYRRSSHGGLREIRLRQFHRPHAGERLLYPYARRTGFP